MKTIVTAVAAALLATAFAVPADAAQTKKKETTVSAAKAASCKAEAKKKYSMMHPLKRRAYEKKCIGTA
jgi:hypothetical protein